MGGQEQVINAQRLIIQGYYKRIYLQKPSIEIILNWLEDDLQTLQMDTALTAASDILNANNQNKKGE